MKAYLVAFITVLFALTAVAQTQVIAHRGASGYLPEHTLEAAILAHGLGVDYIEQDLVLSADSIPVVLHDIHLDTVTNVEQVFPERQREDGRFYVIDFTLAELKQLYVHERQTVDGEQVYANRYLGLSPFRIATFAEHVAMIQGLNRRRGTDIGLYPEIKAPDFHRQEGKDISAIVVGLLNEWELNHAKANIIVQCFDFGSVKRLRTELGLKARLVQLIGENDWQESTTDYDWLRSDEGLAKVAKYADGIGPWYQQLVSISNGKLYDTGLVERARQYHLVIHPYTLRTDQTPNGISYQQLSDYLIKQLDVDGVFADQPDAVQVN